MEKKTPLYEEHVAAGARMVPFAGFLMPIQYSGIIEEHRSVRRRVGMFDLSHMGELRVEGANAVEALDYLVTNDIRSLGPDQIRYTPMCYPEGGIVDDLLVYRYEDHLMLVVNASNIGKDLEWIQEHLPEGVNVQDVSDATALIAVQGPDAERLVGRLTDIDLPSVPYYHFRIGQCAGASVTISRTGYTGEDGFEIYVAPDDATAVWKALQAEGEIYALQPVGLGARDTLRLEAGYMLYGNDIDNSTSPLEAGLGWTVKFSEPDFIGRDVLEQQKTQGVGRRLMAFDMEDRAIPRSHFQVAVDGNPVGEVTSGTFSPTFNRGLGLAYVDAQQAQVGNGVEIHVRDQPHQARLVRKPIYKREGKRNG